MKHIVTMVLFVFCLTAVPAVVGAVPAASSAPAAQQVAKVNINTASAKELEGLPGIGAVTAGRIVAYRTEKGKFKTSNELLKVKGIGKKTMEKIKDLVVTE